MSEFKRNCPECNKEIFYKYEYSLKLAEAKCSLCKSCNNKGDKNPNYNGKIWLGRKHKESAKKKISNRRKANQYLYDNDEYRNKISKVNIGLNNPMYGKSLYSVWLKKFGKEVADSKLLDFRNKMSIANKGENNNMFGKPSPIGSGNGWSGWYNGFYFRSLHELNFLYYAKRFNLKLISAELKRYKIPYINDKGILKNYFCDFIVNDKFLVEIKPKKLRYLQVNKLKFEAGFLYAKCNNLKYKIIDYGPITKDILKILYESNEILLNKKWKIKYESHK